MEHITDEQLCSFYFQFNFDKTNLCKQDCFILEKRKKKDKLQKKKKNCKWQCCNWLKTLDCCWDLMAIPTSED